MILKLLVGRFSLASSNLFLPTSLKFVVVISFQFTPHYNTITMSATIRFGAGANAIFNFDRFESAEAKISRLKWS